jgi:two-component system LytT family response regulator
MNVRALIVDDEQPGRLRLRHLLESESDVTIVGEAETGSSALRLVSEMPVDVVFLDIQMPGMDGFGVLDRFVASPPIVVFVTAFDQHAIRAFDVSALDYLVKPVRPERMQATMQRIRRALAQRRMEAAANELTTLSSSTPGEAPLRSIPAADSSQPVPMPGGTPASTNAPVSRIPVDVRGRTLFIRVTDIDYISAEENYARLHVGKESYLVRSTMRALERSLDPKEFVRIHRGTIVNLDRVIDREYWSSGDYTIRLRDGRKLRLSRSYREQFDRAMGKQGA